MQAESGLFRSHWLVFVAPVVVLVGSIALESLPCSSSSVHLRLLLRSVAVLFAAVPGVYSFIRAEQRARAAAVKASAVDEERTFLLAFDKVQRILIGAIQELLVGEDAGRIRANVMVEEGSTLGVYVGTDLMRLYGDDMLRWEKGQGCCGVAWEQAVAGPADEDWKPVIAPTVSMSPHELRVRWHLTEAQIRLTSHVRWVVSVPIFYKEGDSRIFLGVLNFDGLESLKREERLDENEFLGVCGRLADSLGKILIDEGLIVLDED